MKHVSRRRLLGLALGCGLAPLVWTGCRTVRNTTPVPPEDLAKEGSLVVVRPDRYSVLGTRSVRDYLEIPYEQSAPNAAGLLTVKVGFRNRGGRHWWDLRGPDFAISAKTAFYKDPVLGRGPQGPPIYETNWQKVVLPRGDTAHFEVVCPVAGALHYQITVSELLAQ